MRPAPLVPLLMSGLVLLPASCSSCRPAAPEGPSLVLITVDTLRADRLGCYGRQGARTPAIDRLAAEGTRFLTAVTPLPRTTPAVATMLTGLEPTSHCVRGLWSSLPPEIPTLAGWLRSAGWNTGAFTSNLFLRPGSGLGREFEVYSNPRNRWAGDSAKEVTDEALDWLGRQDGKAPVFLWVHYLDPHWTYDPPAPFDTLFDPDFSGPWPYSDVRPGEPGQGPIIFQNTMTPREVKHAIALYEGEIAATDLEIGRLVGGLERSGRLDRSLVVFTSDHGESLGEHNYYFDHGEYLYDDGLLVPLIVRWPGHVPAGRTIPTMARLSDVAPTILQLMGRPVPSGLDGRSFVDEIRPEKGGTSASPRESWIETDHLYVRPENPRHFVSGIEGKWRGIRGERWKLIFIPHNAAGTEGEVELYDIIADPGETKNLATIEASRAESMLSRLRQHWATTRCAAPAAESGPPDAEILRSLGYL